VIARRAAIVGHNWGIRSPLQALRHADWTVDLLIGRSLARVTDAAASVGIGKASSELDDVWRAGLDLLVIACPWNEHFRLAMAAMGRIPALLLEHPLGATAEESRIVAEAARESGTQVFVNFPTRFMSPVGKLFGLLQSQKRAAIQCVHHFDFPSDEERDWLPLLLTHSLDLSRTLFGVSFVSSAVTLGARTQLTDTCPSWSWPLRGTKTQAHEYASLERLDVTLTGPNTKYDLSIGQSELDSFAETMWVHCGGSTFAYRTSLVRNDERSPWRCSDLWVGPRGGAADLTTSDQGKDIWLEAQCAQIDGITAVLCGREAPHPPAALAPDAAAVHDIIEKAIGGANMR
jgi:predicted dehydrogenase